MNKPIKPTKYIYRRANKLFPFDYVSKKVALSCFMDWCKASVPKNSKDVTLELREDWEYDDCCTYLELSWQEKVLNTKYVSELSKYNKKMLKFKEQK